MKNIMIANKVIKACQDENAKLYRDVIRQKRYIRQIEKENKSLKELNRPKVSNYY